MTSKVPREDFRNDTGEGEERGRVIRFEPRAPKRPPLRVVAPEPVAPDADLEQYTRPREDDDYPHRMAANIAGLAFLVVLVLGGIWLADTMVQMRKNQDCVLMGRSNCAEINVPPQPR